MRPWSRILVLSIVILSIFSPFYMSFYLSCKTIQFVEYDLDDINQIWDQYDEHHYATRTTQNNNSIEFADNLINNNEIFLLYYWDPFVYDEDKLDWTEDPFDDWTWQFYFHSLRMVSYLVDAYELSGDIAYLEKGQWFIESWIEHNPCSRQQASTRAWDDHSTANRITTFIYFWDNYRNSEIFDNEFANEFLNMLRLHGEYTAKSSNYYWGHNHGIYQDRALMQLAVLFPNFESSGEWLEVGISRLSLHLETGVTPSGVHKEHSASYHYLVLGLFMTISKFNHHYDISNDELESTIYKMQEYLVHIAKPDGTVPLVGDSKADYVLGISESQMTNEHLLYLVSNGSVGDEIVEDSIVFQDAGVAIFKNNWDTTPPIYFALFNGFHSSVHKHNDDLSFVLTYQETDYIVDSGKYNFVENDPYRIFIRSIFAHNSIAVDAESYDVRDPDNVGRSVIENYEITPNYSFVKASHTLYEGVKITRSVFFFNDGAVYFHDRIESKDFHKYTQIFNVGNDVNVDYNDTTNVFLSSKIDNTSLTLTQLREFSDFETFNGSKEPMRGWRSTIFNEVSPITTLNYQLEGKDVDFETVINLRLNITNVEVFQDEDKDIYVFKFDNNRTEIIEISTTDSSQTSLNEERVIKNDQLSRIIGVLLLISLGAAITVFRGRKKLKRGIATKP